MKNSKKKYKNLYKFNSKLLKKIWPIVLISGVVILFFWKIFFKGQAAIPGDFIVGTYFPWLDYEWGYPAGVPVKNPITTDVVSFTYPIRILVVDLIKNGHWPLWDQYILTGTPLLASIQAAVFTPTNIFYFLFDNITAWNFQIISQHFLASLFVYMLLRHWGLKKVSSIFGGIVYAFSGFNMVWSQWNERSLTAAFIPLLILLEDKFLIEGKWKYGFLFSLAFFLQIATGYPQLVLYSVATLFLYWMFISILRVKEKFGIENYTSVLTFLKKEKELFIRSIFLAIFILLGLGLSSVQTLPAQELLNLSQRVIEPIEKSEIFFPFEKTITIIAPDFFGNPATGNYWGPQDYTSTTGFVGFTALILAIIAFFLFKKNNTVKFFVLLLFISLLLSYQTPISLFIWNSGIFGLQAAMAHRAMILFTLSISILSAFGLDEISDNDKSKYLPYLIFPGILIILFGAYALTAYLMPSIITQIGILPMVVTNAYIALKNLVFPFIIFVLVFSVFFLYSKKILRKSLFATLLLIISVWELFRFGWKYTPFSDRGMVYPTTPVIDFLLSQEKPFRVTTTDVIPINIKMTYGLESLEGYGALFPLSIAEFISYLNSAEVDNVSPQGRYGNVTNLNSPLLNITNTKYLLAIKRNSKGIPDENGEVDYLIRNLRFKKVFEDKSVVVLENLENLPRAFMVYDWEVISVDRDVAIKLLSNSFPHGKKIIISESPGIEKSNSNSKYSLVYEKYKDQESVISVETEEDGLLYISDLDYPGWKAYLDGTETKIYKANYAFRAIMVPEGKHTVRMVYEPQSFRNGVWFSLISFAILVLSYPIYSSIGKKRSVPYTNNK